MKVKFKLALFKKHNVLLTGFWTQQKDFIIKVTSSKLQIKLLTVSEKIPSEFTSGSVSMYGLYHIHSISLYMMSRVIAPKNY